MYLQMMILVCFVFVLPACCPIIQNRVGVRLLPEQRVLLQKHLQHSHLRFLCKLPVVLCTGLDDTVSVLFQCVWWECVRRLLLLENRHHTIGLRTPSVCLLLYHPPSSPCMHIRTPPQGTLFNALAVGACVYGVGATGILSVEWMPAAALLFGVITSAVDPVAVSVVI